jgi:hypothetical protein
MTALFKQLPILLKKRIRSILKPSPCSKGDVLTYYATVLGQNNDKAAFKQTNETPKQLTFENLKHDYPKKITYTHKTTIELAVKISGIQQGKPTSEEFIMKKIK